MSVRRQARGEERRQEILHATLELIERGGVEAGTHRAVGEGSGGPLGSVTYYFPTKDELLREALEWWGTGEVGRPAAVGAGAGGGRPGPGAGGDASGLPLGSVTYYFPTKDELLREALECWVTEEVERLSSVAAAIESENLSPAEGAARWGELLRGNDPHQIAQFDLYLQAARDPSLRDA